MRMLVVWLLLISGVVHAEDDTQLVHDLAHAGTSYFLATSGYGLSKSAFRMEPADARIYSGFASFAIGVGYLGLSSLSTHQAFNWRGLGANLLGIGLSTLTTWQFDF